MFTFTDSAVAKIKELIEEEGNETLMTRVFVQGGGCSGFQYGITFDETQNDDDFVSTYEGLTILIDSVSSQYLDTATVDYTEDLNGSQFVFSNPAAVTTCGCGSSFAV